MESGPAGNSWLEIDEGGFAENLKELSKKFDGSSVSGDQYDEHPYGKNSVSNTSSSSVTQNLSAMGDQATKESKLKGWLSSVQLSQYYETLAANDIDLNILEYLKKDDLKDLIPKVGDRIRLWKAICELVSQPTNYEELSRAQTLDSGPPSSAVSKAEPTTTVKFHALDNKAIHLDLRPRDPILAVALQTAKLPHNGSYKINDGFDYYEDDNSLRDAIFKRGTLEFWIQLGSQHPSSNRENDSANGVRTLTLSDGLPSSNEAEELPNFRLTDRPTSSEVASRISDFFPSSKQKLIAEGLRNSVLINRRFSTLTSGWRSSIRASRRFSSLTMPDIAAEGQTDVATKSKNAIESILDHATELPEQDSQFLEMLDNEVMSPSEWIRGKLVGSGSFGSVYLAFNVFSGDIMAVKQVQLLQNDSRQKKMVEAMHQEIRTLRGLEHVNIVQYRGFKSEGEFLNIFLEYVPGGSLASKLANNGPLDENAVRGFIKQCLAGLAYLHQRGIIHRDIKGANILVDTDNVAKISDFGLSKHEDAAKNRFSMQGTAFWMAPEVARAREQTTTKADIWSLGCLIIELLTGQHPFPKLQAFQAIYKIGKGSIPDLPEGLSPELEDVLVSCLKPDPKERPGAIDLLKHPFFE